MFFFYNNRAKYEVEMYINLEFKLNILFANYFEGRYTE